MTARPDGGGEEHPERHQHSDRAGREEAGADRERPISVVHSVNDYPDDTREAVLMACTVKDGKIRRVETGATPLEK